MDPRSNNDVSHLIERLEAFEDRLGVSLEGLYASQNTQIGSIAVNGELHPLEGTELSRDVDIVVTLYDVTGRVIGTRNEHVRSKNFFGFEAFSATFFEPGGPPIAKIRIYPKAR